MHSIPRTSCRSPLPNRQASAIALYYFYRCHWEHQGFIPRTSLDAKYPNSGFSDTSIEAEYDWQQCGAAQNVVA
jgi:hypothetical protein